MKVFREISLSILTILFLTVGVTYAQSPAEESYNKGVEYAVQGEFLKAKEEFEKALRDDPFFRPAEQHLIIIKDVIEQKIAGSAGLSGWPGLYHSGSSAYGSNSCESKRSPRKKKMKTMAIVRI